MKRSAPRDIAHPSRSIARFDPWLSQWSAAQRIAIAAVAALPWFGGASAQAASCSVEYAELAGVSGMPRARTYVCPLSSRPGRSSLRVTFLRLDEALAGNLVLGEKVPEVDQLLGGTRLIENDVRKELRGIFDRYSHQETIPAKDVAFTITVKSPLADGSSERKTVNLPRVGDDRQSARRLFSISALEADFDQSHQYSIDLPDVTDAIIKRRTWPAGFKHFYYCTNDALQCTRIWRYVARLQELDAIEQATGRMVRSMGETGRGDQSDWESDFDPFKKHFALLRYLGRAGWPGDFMVIQGDSITCTTAFEYNYIMPPFALDAALVENRSTQPVRVRDFLGLAQGGGLRPASGAMSSGSVGGSLGMGEQVIPAGGKIMIPMRIVLIGGMADPDFWGSMDQAKEMYRDIMAKKDGTVFVQDSVLSEASPVTVRIRKNKSSFLPPELPNRVEYWFGPQLSLSGFVIEDENIALEQGEPNWITLFGTESAKAVTDSSNPDTQLHVRSTANDSGASCPILYSWDEGLRDWVRLGKVIDTANSADKETTSTIEVGVDVRRFRLAEEEPEISFVRRVQLILSLRDGRRVPIDPVGQSPLGNRFRFTIPAYSRADFRFDVPAEYEIIGLVHAEIAVTGFYRRYSEIMVAKALESVDGRQ